MRSPPKPLFLMFVLLLGCDAAPANTLTITRGGTYSGGEYEGVAIDTAEPVVMENMTLRAGRGGGHLITSHYRRANVVICNVRGYGANPNVAGKATGRFASLEGFANVVVENCLLEGTAGIYLLDYAGDRTGNNTIKILRNRATNIDGRKSDGRGGYLPGGEQAAELVQFVQFDKVRAVADVEIAWNEVVNEPFKSRVEDVISIYLSSGTKDSPIKIHDNFMRGAYPLDPATEDFSGGGIMLGDGVAKDSPGGDPAFVEAFDNQVLDTTNYGIAISAGHDCTMYRNRIVSAGLLPDGRTKIAAQNVGAYVWDSYKAGKDRFYNNGGRDNLIGWKDKAGNRNDWWRPDAATWANNEKWPSPVNVDVYEAEWKRWLEKLKANDVTIGAQKRAPG
jgi:hypothetical protein